MKTTVISKIDKIMKCKKCNLCKNQKPLLDKNYNADIMWVGLSAKKVDDVTIDIPLAVDTNSGKLIAEIESNCSFYKFYKSNLVKCLPLDGNEKLRYPTKKEIESCIGNLFIEINEIKPKIVFLLGNRVSSAVGKAFELKFNGLNEFDYEIYEKDGIGFVPIHHPSYISVYKRKFVDLYINGINSIFYPIL